MIRIFLAILFSSSLCNAQRYSIEWVTVGVKTSIRSLSVVNDVVAWAAGSNGFICRTTNGGITWNAMKIPGHENLDFRSVYAFDRDRAVSANAGSPARILYTNDAGASWRVVYENKHSAAFIDGIDFWKDGHGLAYGDPIDGKMLLVRSEDRGLTWRESGPESRPRLNSGEASFAASSTGIRCYGEGMAIIATGGSVSRLFISTDRAKTWKAITCPILQGAESRGIFSVSEPDGNSFIVVGGDFKIDSLREKNVYLTDDLGKSWKEAEIPTRGYRECVERLTKENLIAVGPGGSEFSSDSGNSWWIFSNEKNFHVVRKARSGSLILMAGNDGKIGIIREQ